MEDESWADEEIVEQLFQRQEAALQAVKRKYERLCRQVAGNVLALPEDVSECVNDAYFTLWRLIPPQRPDKLPAFLLKLVRNLALKRYAYNAAQKRDPNLRLPLDELAEALPGGLQPEEVLGRKDLAVAVNAFLRGQSRLNRQLFLRRYWYFEPLKEAAEQAGLSAGAAAARLCRMRAGLRDYLQKEGFEI